MKFQQGEVIWSPTPAQFEKTRLHAYMTWQRSPKLMDIESLDKELEELY